MSIFKELLIITLPSLFILKALMFTQSNFNEITSTQFDHGYYTPTRNKEDLQYPKHSLTFTEKLPLYMGKMVFNNLPIYIKEEIMKNTFKYNKFINFNFKLQVP